MAALRPAGPPPTMHTSTWSVSLSTDLGSKELSGVVAKRNRVAFEKARRSPAMRIAGLNVVRGKDRDVGLRTQEVMRSLLEGNESAERRMADDTGDREAITILRKAIDSKNADKSEVRNAYDGAASNSTCARTSEIVRLKNPSLAIGLITSLEHVPTFPRSNLRDLSDRYNHLKISLGRE
jgi:hypothetical protein